jgi:NNP family nitrate/nitrite transporter-like MFS transporter
VRDGRLAAVRGDEAHPVNAGRTCRKPLELPAAVSAADRALTPLLLFLSSIPSLTLAAVGFPLVMGTLGLGNGATFQLVGLRFRARIAVVTGLVGAAGGLGGFLLPIALGSLHDSFGGYGAGLSIAAVVVAVAFVGVNVLRVVWRRGWGAAAEAPV